VLPTQHEGKVAQHKSRARKPTAAYSWFALRTGKIRQLQLNAEVMQDQRNASCLKVP